MITACSQMLLCLDDMHLTKADKYGSFPCIELLRQLQQEQGWYERKALNWKVRVPFNSIKYACRWEEYHVE